MEVLQQNKTMRVTQEKWLIKTKHLRCKGSRKNVDKTKCYPLTLSVIKLFLLLPHFKSGSEENFLHDLIVLTLLRPPLTFNFQDLR